MAATPMYYVPTQHPGQLGQPVVSTAPGEAAYYAPSQGVVMVPQVPKYEYTPNDYMAFSILTSVICGIFSPLSLVFTVPAWILSRQSQIAARMGDIDTAVKKGMIAAYLNVAAITVSLSLAVVVTGLIVGLSGRDQYSEDSHYYNGDYYNDDYYYNDYYGD